VWFNGSWEFAKDSAIFRGRSAAIVAGLGDDDAGPGVADKNGLAVLLRQRLFGGIDVRGKRGERIFDERHVVALLREDVGNGLPTRLVDESAVHEHDIVSRPLGHSRLGGGGNSGDEDGGR
jgi:hypothetical protein